MKSTDFKRIGKHLGVKLIMVLLCLTLICSSVSVFAMTQIAEEDRMGHGDNGDGRYYSSFTSNDELKAVTKETNIEIAGEGAILVDPLDEEAIAAQLLRLETDRQVRADQAAYGLARAPQFTWEATARKLLDLYRSVAAQ